MINSLSSLFRLNWNDWAKGLVMVVLGASLTLLQQEWMSHMIVWSNVFDVGGLAGLAYILKNFFSTSDGKVVGTIG